MKNPYINESSCWINGFQFVPPHVERAAESNKRFQEIVMTLNPNRKKRK